MICKNGIKLTVVTYSLRSCATRLPWDLSFPENSSRKLSKNVKHAVKKTKCLAIATLKLSPAQRKFWRDFTILFGSHKILSEFWH